jgi:hypothetical protein
MRTPYFSVLTNLFYRYRAPENTWNTWPGPYLGILRPGAQENVPPSVFLLIPLCLRKKKKKKKKDKRQNIIVRL